MRLVYSPQPALKGFIERNIARCSGRGLPQPGMAIGVINADSELIGGFYYHDYDPDAGVIEISGASLDKKWLTKATLYGLFAYPFHDLHCQLVAMRHSAKDIALARMLKAYGFQQATIPRLFGRGEDAIISTLTLEDWEGNAFTRSYLQRIGADIG